MGVEPLVRPGGPDLGGTRGELHVLVRVLPAVPASTVLALARMSARVACRAWRVPHVADDAVLLASELVTAAVRAPFDRDRPDRAPFERVPMDRVQQEVVRAITCRGGVGPSGPDSQAWASWC